MQVCTQVHVTMQVFTQVYVTMQVCTQVYVTMQVYDTSHGCLQLLPNYQKAVLATYERQRQASDPSLCPSPLIPNLDHKQLNHDCQNVFRRLR
jgi:hypothetical protein